MRQPAFRFVGLLGVVSLFADMTCAGPLLLRAAATTPAKA
jgi:hypothetical protein